MTEAQKMRADRLFFEGGFTSLIGTVFLTSKSLLFQPIYLEIKNRRTAGYFVYDGFYRRLIPVRGKSGEEKFFDLLKDAFPLDDKEYGQTINDFRLKLEKALAYQKMSDVSIITLNFQLILDNMELVLGTKHYRNAKTHNLYAGFAYGGSHYYSATTLFRAWSEGKLRHPCPNCNGSAYVLYGAGGLSSGMFAVWCHECRGLHTVKGFFGQHFADINHVEPYPTDGYRLDETIEELGGVLPGDVCGLKEGGNAGQNS